AKVLAAKGIKPRRWIVRFLNRLLHVDELNEAFDLFGDREGVEFAKAAMDYLNITVDLKNAERIPKDGNPIIIANHPLGGPDGMALIAAVGSVRDDIRFPVNDFLMYVEQLKPVFVPIDKVHGNRNTAGGINAAFAEDNCLLYFPAGLCSRRIKGKITDLEWKPTVVKKAIQHHRDLIPVHIEAKNRCRFYTIANLRKRLGIKFNFEMALLPSEMFAQRGKTFTMTVGEPIPWQTLDDGTPAIEWAKRLHDLIYTIK
ncbi:MAG: 1-acyl-sn-glycerol-3-phosphate acyltransferase, partial [Bacteroidales bacterium]|nr:1-acyl-sn-glycerol-3-phosphate acyltransferase [Bacteroidales bacterium]